MTRSRSEQDVIIIGGGPAGLSAALCCAELGLNAILFERRREFGGQLLHIYNAITNYPGVPSTDGRTLLDLFARQIREKGCNIQTEAEVIQADLPDRAVVLADGSEYTGRTIVLATGVRRRKLGISGEAAFLGRGVLESGIKSRDEVADKTVLIVGGGDAAIENAVILSEKAAKVIVIHRSETFRARRSFLEAAASRANIEFVTGYEVCAIVGADKVQMVEIRNNASGEIRRFEIDAVLIRVGFEPNSELFGQQLDRDAAGYLHIDGVTNTGARGIFAIGDLVNPLAPMISTAAGQGTMAGVMAARCNSR